MHRCALRERRHNPGKEGVIRVKDDEQLLVGLDIGTTKICVVVGKATENQVNIIGIGSHPSTGLRKGVVVNMDSTVNSIKKASRSGAQWPASR
jgi:Ethanolamine utilization protein EutJ (predicted chaperonin)